MEALRETTGGLFPAHTYLLDGANLVAYIRSGTKTPFYFRAPIKGFSKSGRKFERVPNVFKRIDLDVDPSIITVKGSKGETYTVNTQEHTCTCQGYTYRGTCKHIKEQE